MSIFFNYKPPPFEMTKKQRGYYEFWISEVVAIYYPKLPSYTAAEKVKAAIKAKVSYSTSKEMTKLQFNNAIQLLKAYIYKANPNYKPPFYTTQNY